MNKMIDIYGLIASKYSKMTDSARPIAKIILTQKAEIANSYTITQLAKEAHVSNAMIVKFAKNLGLEGFEELKYLIKYQKPTIEVQEHNHLHEITRTLHNCHSNIASQKKLMSDLMERKQSIYILARSTSANYAFDFYYRLSKIRDNVYFERRQEKQKLFLDQITSNDLIIIVSNSGDSTELVDFSKTLQKKMRVETILITNNLNCKLAKYATHILEGASFEVDELLKAQAPLSSKYSLLYILDSLFYEYFYANYKKSIDKLYTFNYSDYVHLDIINY